MTAKLLKGAPATFKSTDCKIPEMAGKKLPSRWLRKTAPAGGACAYNWPGQGQAESQPQGAGHAFPAPPARQEVENFDFSSTLPDVDATQVKLEDPAAATS